MFSYQFLEDWMDCLLFSFIPIIKGNFFTIKKNNLAINFDVKQAWKIAKQYFMSEYFYLNWHFVTKAYQVHLKQWSALETQLLAKLIRK